MVTNLVDT